VLNGEKYLETALRSVLEQTYPNVELLVFDGGSCDGTVSILKRYNDQIDYWASEPDGGIYDAWNKAVKTAQGEWIAFLGSDDRYFPDALRSYVDYILETERDLDYVSSRNVLLYPDGTTRRVGSAWNWATFRVRMNVAHVGSLHHRRLFERLGLYNTDYRIVGDYELLLRAGSALCAGFIDVTAAEMQVGGVCDSVRALAEARRAKIITAGRSSAAATLEDVWARIKFVVRKQLGRG
jgi:glycosyltransferase involved in cell wall biosynthesis